MTRFAFRFSPLPAWALFYFISYAPAHADAAAPPKPLIAADAVQEAFVRVAEKIRPSVVTIYAERLPTPSTPPLPDPPGTDKAPNDKTPNDDRDEDNDDLPFPFGPRDPDARRTSLGTGVVVNAQGDILTNYHVVKGAGVIRVLFNSDAERPIRPLARLIAFDEESDLAVVRLTQRPAGPSPAPVEFADSDEVRIGQWAIAVGAPFDQAQSVTVGIVSAKARHLDREGKLSLQDYIQTDASINPGNSGGPLVDLEGKVIGINTAILSPSRFNVGIGFSVPSNTVRAYLPLLTQGKSIARGFLGIQYAALDENVAREFGLKGGMQIGALAKRGNEFIGPAKQAGLQEGDIITHVNDEEIISSSVFRRVVAGSAPGSKLKFTVARPETNSVARKEFTVVLGDWNTQNAGADTNSTLPAPAAPANSSQLGLELEDIEKLTANQRELFGLEKTAKGVLITDIAPASPADDAEVRRGLRIERVRINGGAWQNVTGKNAFTALEKTLSPGARVLLQVRDRQNVSVYKLIVLPTAA